MPVFTFSTRGTKPQDTETIKRVKAICDKRRINFSGLVLDLLIEWEATGGVATVDMKRDNAAGLSGTSLYRSWYNMKARCTNPKSPNYRFYGAKGRTIPAEWHVFEHFYLDMAEGHFEGAHLDRIDNDGDYCKDNCQWLTRDDHFAKTGEDKRL